MADLCDLEKRVYLHKLNVRQLTYIKQAKAGLV